MDTNENASRKSAVGVTPKGASYPRGEFAKLPLEFASIRGFFCMVPVNPKRSFLSFLDLDYSGSKNSVFVLSSVAASVRVGRIIHALSLAATVFLKLL